MTAQAGKDMLLKIEGAPVASPGVFTTVAGLRARTISLNAKTVDATDGDSAGRWRELLAGAGVKSAAVSGQGIFRDAASDALVREAFFDQAAKRWRLIVPDFGVLEGPFLVPAQEAADAIEAAFGRAGDSLTRSLARAAADGEVSLAELARAVLNAVSAAAGANGGGLSAAIQSVMSSFGGARADGGPVLGGGAYLVGERGPEVFRPATGGEIGPVGGGGVTVNVAVDGGAPALLRSEAQIAQMLARAVSLGARRM